MSKGLRWYLVSTACYLLPGGIQMVLFSWLVAIFLAESPARLGIAQMASQLPMLFLLLWGGVLGDRVDQRRLLIGLQGLLIFPPLVMASLIYVDRLSYELLIVWAVLSGSLGAFVQPARDALLSRVAGNDIQRIVTLVIGIQFGIQILGFAVGSTADWLGPSLVLMTQSLMLLAAAVTTVRIPELPKAGPATRKPVLKEIGEGLSIAFQSIVIKPVIILTFSIGVLFAGAYMVLLPLMVRNLYDGGSLGIALAFGSNMAGTCTTIYFLMLRGGVDFPGRALILSGVISSMILFVLHFELPQWGFYFVIYLWGLCAGISMTMTRAIVQEAAPDSHRARLMSIYSLAMMGGMPLGSFMLGFCAESFGVRGAVLIPVVAMLFIIAYLRFGTELWKVNRGHPNGNQK